MAYELGLDLLGTLTATANYSSALQQFTVMQSTATGVFTQQVTVGGPVIGVLQDLPSSGFVGSLAVGGVTKVRVNTTAQAAIVSGDKLCASTGGGVIGSTAVGRFVIGRSLGAVATNATGIIQMRITMEGAGSTSAGSGA